MSEEIEWFRLPVDLQHKFFEEAEKQSRALVDTIRSLAAGIEGLKQELGGRIQPLPQGDRTFKVAAVDSSRSPRLSERLGVRFGVFAGAITYVTGTTRRDEFRAAAFRRDQAFSEERSKFYFDLLTAWGERKLAVEALEEADLVIVDGEFFGFLYPAIRMKRENLYGREEENKVREAFECTEQLLKSGKVIAVIKRSHTRAIGGYLAVERGDYTFVSVLDKLLLSLIMPPQSFFDYHLLIGKELVPLYTHAARLARRGVNREELLDQAKAYIFERYEDLRLDAKEYENLRRIQVRAYREAPPCEIEYPSRIPQDRLLEWLAQPGFFNPATNLPMALDLVDSAANIPAKFTDEFVEEVEGRLLQLVERDGGNPEAVRVFFQLLNPQKAY